MKIHKERPILFSGPMVRAIREGRKTQTRRILKPQRNRDGFLFGPDYVANEFQFGDDTVRCPYGKPEDRLWVRETWAMEGPDGSSVLPIQYKADRDDWLACSKWKPSIFMPRWASRITLEIVSVRAERLKNISNEDCWNEGMCDETNLELKANRKWFSELWESINGPGSWDRNPWVWVIEFKEVK